MRRLPAIGILAISLRAAAPARFVGARTCAACHPAEFASQSASAHAGALSPVSDHADFPAGSLSRELSPMDYVHA